MNFLILISILSLIPHACRMEQPLGSCSVSQPFRMDDSTCSSFAEICIRGDSSYCRSILNSCSQCPPSNYTISMLATLSMKINELTNLTKQIKDNKNSSKFSQRKLAEDLTKTGLNKAFVYICLTLCVITLLILLASNIILCKNQPKRKKSKNAVQVDDIEMMSFMETNTKDDKVNDINKKENCIPDKQDPIEKQKDIEKENVQFQDIDNIYNKLKDVDNIYNKLKDIDNKIQDMEAKMHVMHPGLSSKLDNIALTIVNYVKSANTNMTSLNTKVDDLIGLSNPLQMSHEYRDAIAEVDSKDETGGTSNSLNPPPLVSMISLEETDPDICKQENKD